MGLIPAVRALRQRCSITMSRIRAISCTVMSAPPCLPKRATLSCMVCSTQDHGTLFCGLNTARLYCRHDRRSECASGRGQIVNVCRQKHLTSIRNAPPARRPP